MLTLVALALVAVACAEKTSHSVFFDERFACLVPAL